MSKFFPFSRTHLLSRCQLKTVTAAQLTVGARSHWSTQSHVTGYWSLIGQLCWLQPADCRRRGRRGLVWPYWPRVSCTVLISRHWPVSTTTYCQPGDLTRSVSNQVQEETTLLWNVKIKKESCWNTLQGRATTFTLILKWKSWWIEWFVKVTDERGLLMFLHIAFKAATKSIKQIFLQLDRSCLFAAEPGSCLQSFVWSIISILCQIWSSVTK